MSDTAPRLALRLSTRNFARLQFGVITVILLAGVANYVLAACCEAWGLRVLQILDVGAEASLPTWFSVLNLALAAMLAAGLGAAGRGQARGMVVYWLLLALLMLGLSFDESVQMHEKLQRAGAALAPQLPQIATHGWVVIGSLFALGTAVLFLPFLWRLPRRLARLMGLAGTVFVGGAVGVESLGAIADFKGWLERDDLLYQLRRIGEEGMEMYAIALFNWALYREWASRHISLIAVNE